MPILTKYDPESHRLELVMSGTISFQDLANQFQRFSDNPKYPAIRSCIHNLLAVERVELNIAGASNLGEITKQLSPHLICEREAWVSDNGEWIGLGVVYGMVSIPGREFRVFRDLKKAREWVQGHDVSDTGVIAPSKLHNTGPVQFPSPH